MDKENYSFIENQDTISVSSKCPMDDYSSCVDYDNETTAIEKTDDGSMIEETIRDVCWWHREPIFGEVYSIPLVRKGDIGIKYTNSFDRAHYIRDGKFCHYSCGLAFALERREYAYKAAVSNIVSEQLSLGNKSIITAPHWKLITRGTHKGIMSVEEYEKGIQQGEFSHIDPDHTLFPICYDFSINTDEYLDNTSDETRNLSSSFLSA